MGCLQNDSGELTLQPALRVQTPTHDLPDLFPLLQSRDEGSSSYISELQKGQLGSGQKGLGVWLMDVRSQSCCGCSLGFQS